MMKCQDNLIKASIKVRLVLPDWRGGGPKWATELCSGGMHVLTICQLARMAALCVNVQVYIYIERERPCTDAKSIHFFFVANLSNITTVLI